MAEQFVIGHSFTSGRSLRKCAPKSSHYCAVSEQVSAIIKNFAGLDAP
jgi:hypothetical protein